MEDSYYFAGVWYNDELSECPVCKGKAILRHEMINDELHKYNLAICADKNCMAEWYDGVIHERDFNE